MEVLELWLARGRDFPRRDRVYWPSSTTTRTWSWRPRNRPVRRQTPQLRRRAGPRPKTQRALELSLSLFRLAARSGLCTVASLGPCTGARHARGRADSGERTQDANDAQWPFA